MLKITIIGRFLSQQEKWTGSDSGGTDFGNHLLYPRQALVDFLNAQGCRLYSRAELAPECADALIVDDLDHDLWRYVQTLPVELPKLLICCESPSYALESHDPQVLSDPTWSQIMTWNRTISGPNVTHYDIAVTGTQLDAWTPGDFSPRKPKGVIVISCRLYEEFRGLVFPRTAFCTALADAGHIDVYGKGWPVQPGKGLMGPSANKLQTISQYRFALAIENSIDDGYVTEKLPDCILALTPTIYLGDFTTAQRRYPNTFVQLRGLTVDSFLDAKFRLDDEYPALQAAVQAARNRSSTWCDSVHQTFRDTFLKLPMREGRHP